MSVALTLASATSAILVGLMVFAVPLMSRTYQQRVVPIAGSPNLSLDPKVGDQLPTIAGVLDGSSDQWIVFAAQCTACTLPSYRQISDQLRKKLGRNLVFVVPDASSAEIYRENLKSVNAVIVGRAPRQFNAVFSPRGYVVSPNRRLTAIQNSTESLRDFARRASGGE